MTDRALKRLRIGWVVGKYAAQPAIRWRFGWYATRRGLSVEEAVPGRSYDVIWLSQAADYTRWCAAGRERGRIILDLCDDYLSEPSFTPTDILRQAAKFAIGQNARLTFSYTRAIQAMCRRADAVVCATDLQAQRLKPLCANVHQILDTTDEVATQVKTDYRAAEPVNLVWQGLPALDGLRSIVPALSRTKAKMDLALHLITGIKMPTLLRDYRVVHTKNQVERIFPFDHVYLYEWNRFLFAKIITACDLALIPLQSEDRVAWGKPANRLLIFWAMGVPTLASPTPAYESVMRQCGLEEMLCSSPEEWEDKLVFYMRNASARQKAGALGMEFVRKHHSSGRLLALWDAVIESVI